MFKKDLVIHKAEKKSGETFQYQYHIHITPDQTYYSNLFNTQEELDAWFTKQFSEPDKPVVDSFHGDRWGE